MNYSARTRSIWIASLAVPLMFGIMAPLQQRIDAKTTTIEQEKQELLFSSPAVLQKLSLGYSSLLADIYWTRVIQYYGSAVQASNPDFQLLAPLLNITTGLDPNLIVAYKVGAILLSEHRPVGAGRPDLAAELVERGIAANPNDWWLKADLGFIYYWHLHDFQKAADAYLAGSQDPGAPVWMKPMAARILEQGGSLEVSRSMWSQVYDSTDDVHVRQNALKHVRALQAELDIRQLNGIVAAYQQQFQESASSFEELVEAHMLRGLPLDPAGVPYIIDPDGVVQLNSSSPIDLSIIQPLSRNRAASH